MNAKGEVLKPLDEGEVQALAKAIAEQGIEAVAVCFLHAYANPAHERRVGDILRAANPRLFVTLSHEIVREYREYERTSTTALNAFVGPRVQAYLGRLETYLRDETLRRQDQHHALERRRDVGAARAGAAGVDDGVRPGRRHDRRRTARGAARASSAPSASTWAAPPPRRA